MVSVKIINGILIKFEKHSQKNSKYDFNSFLGFGSIDKVLVYENKKSAEKEELHKVIGRAKLTADDKNLYYEAEIYDTLPSLNFQDKLKEEDFIYLPIINKNKIISIYPESIGKITKKS
jgi:hypothetical protein